MAITFFIIMRSRRAAHAAQARALQSVSPSVDIEASCATAATKSFSAICTVPDRRMDTVTTHSDASLRPETPGKSDFAHRKPDFAPPPPTSMRAPPPPIPMRAPPPPTPMRELTPRRRPPPTAPAIAAADEAAEEARRQPRKRHRHRRPRDGANAADGAAPNAPPPQQQLPPQQQSPQPRRPSSRNLKRHASSWRRSLSETTRWCMRRCPRRCASRSTRCAGSSATGTESRARCIARVSSHAR